MEVKINKEIQSYSESMFLGLSMRQCGFSLAAVLVAVGLYFLLKPYVGTETVSWMCILGAAPFAAMGFVNYHGMTAEQLVRIWIRSELLEPKRLISEPDNLYYKLLEEEELGFERTHFSQQVEATQASPCTSKASDTVVTESAQVSNGFHNTSFSPGDTPRKKEIPIKKKSDLPIRTRNSSVPIKTSERAAKKVSDTTAKHAAQKAQKAATAAAQKSVHAAATAGRRAALAAKKAAELTAKLARSAAEAVKALYAAIGAGGVAAVLVIVIVVLIGCSAAIFGSQDDSTETLPLSAEVEAYEPVIRKYAKQYGIPDYVLLTQAVMMQESGGRGNDPMQASECGYNTQYPRTPGGITDPEYSIAVGIQNLADCLQTAGAESPIDLEHIQLALQGYNFGSGYITWALRCLR